MRWQMDHLSHRHLTINDLAASGEGDGPVIFKLESAYELACNHTDIIGFCGRNLSAGGDRHSSTVCARARDLGQR